MITDNNLVTNVTPLRRGYWPELTTISLSRLLIIKKSIRLRIAVP